MDMPRRTFLSASVATASSVFWPRIALSTGNVGVISGRAFGGTWRLVHCGPAIDARLRRLIENILSRVDAQMSPWNPNADLTRFNSTVSVDPQPMPQDLCSVAKESLLVASMTGGAFDPTVGPTVARFGFGPIEGLAGRFSDITVDGHTIAKRQGRLTLDLCGIAKGYALDQIMDTLANEGVHDAVLEIGGEVATVGRHPSGRSWKVAIEQPGSRSSRAQRIIVPGKKALASSGLLPNGYVGRVRTSHLIDPREGRPVDNGVAGVSVLAQTGMRADALATAFTVLGREKGVALAERLGVSALFLSLDGAAFSETMTGDFRAHVIA